MSSLHFCFCSSYLVCSIWFLISNWISLVECQFQQFFEQAQPANGQAQWVPWQQPQQVQQGSGQPFWQQQQQSGLTPAVQQSHYQHNQNNHHHHHHIHNNPQQQRVQQHFPPFQQQDKFIPYQQEQFSSLDGAGEQAEMREELPELFKPPVIFHLPHQSQDDSSQWGHEEQLQGQQNWEQPNNYAVLYPLQHPQQIRRPAPLVLPPKARPLPNRKITAALQRNIGVNLPRHLGSNRNLLPASATTTRRPRVRVLTPASRRATATTTTNAPPLAKNRAKVPDVAGDQFDLPPPPPARFLPEEEKAQIAELVANQQQQQQQIRNGVDQDIVRPSKSDDFPTLLIVTTVPTSTDAPSSTLARLSSLPPATTVSPRERGGNTRPNKIFLQCCKTKKVPRSCESRCNFDVLNRKILTAMFLNTDKCPSEYGLELFTCAAQGSDHTECCKQKRVQKTAAGNKCLSFCDLSPDAPKVQADASYLPCWAVLNEIKDCFRDKIASTATS